MNYPEWVIPDGVDLDQLRVTTEQMVVEFSRPVEQWVSGRSLLSNPRAWRYVGTDPRDRRHWGSSWNLVPAVFLCPTALSLKQGKHLRRVLQETLPDICWTLEDFIGISTISVPERRNFRLEWLNKLKEKLDES